MSRLLASGRAHFGSLAGPRARRWAKPRAGTPDWTITPDGLRAPVLRVEPAADRVLPLLPPWYIDTARAEGGPVTLQVPAELVQRLLWLPPLTQAESELVADTLAEVAPALPAPTQRGEPPVELGGAPVPVLRLETRPALPRALSPVRAPRHLPVRLRPARLPLWHGHRRGRRRTRLPSPARRSQRPPDPRRGSRARRRAASRRRRLHSRPAGRGADELRQPARPMRSGWPARRPGPASWLRPCRRCARKAGKWPSRATSATTRSTSTT